MSEIDFNAVLDEFGYVIDPEFRVFREYQEYLDYYA